MYVFIKKNVCQDSCLEHSTQDNSIDWLDFLKNQYDIYIILYKIMYNTFYYINNDIK